MTGSSPQHPPSPKKKTKNTTNPCPPFLFLFASLPGFACPRVCVSAFRCTECRAPRCKNARPDLCPAGVLSPLPVAICVVLFHFVPAAGGAGARAKTVWPSGLRRWLQAPSRKGVGSNPTAVTLSLRKEKRTNRSKPEGRSFLHTSAGLWPAPCSPDPPAWEDGHSRESSPGHIDGNDVFCH